MRNASVSRVLSDRLTTLSPDTPVARALALFTHSDREDLPVIEGRRLVGVVSSADLLKLFQLDNGAVPGDLTVGQIMQPKPTTLTTAATLRDAAEALLLGSIHALPVIDSDNRFVGVVTWADVIEHLLTSLPVHVQEVRSGELDRVRALKAVAGAAARYLQSGHGEREHSVLVRCIANARKSDSSIYL